MPTLQPEFEIDIDTAAPSEHRTGIASPFAVNPSGGLSLASGERNDVKIIRNALLGQGSLNPFQQPEEAIDAALFDMHDPTSQAIVRRKLERVFERFEQQNRYRLITDSIEFREEVDGETSVYFTYHNLESDTTSTLGVGPTVG